MDAHRKNWPKYIVGFIACFLIRLVPARPPNIEPILMAQMPFSKAHGALAGFAFAFFSMALYDIATSKVGIWTFITAFAYGLLGIWAAAYFKDKKSSSWNYAKFAVMATLFFDAATGLSVGPLFFHQPFLAAFLGQIPFTLLHLAGNVTFAVALSPLIYRWATAGEKIKFESAIKAKIFNPKQA